MGSRFKLHVIPPPKPLNWESPRALLKDTFFNHLIQDPAPIGHFYIEIDAQIPSPGGVKRVVTGMSRAQKNISTLRVLLQQIGLGTFFHDFPGVLDQRKRAIAQIDWARAKGRLKTVSVGLSDERAKELFDELQAWIQHGSFRHYGGGHDLSKGEGSGCAEFGVHFLNLALGERGVPLEWIRSVYAPKQWVGGPRTGRKVSWLRLLREGAQWARDESSGILYRTPDMDLTWAWLEKVAPGQVDIELELEKWGGVQESKKRIAFSDCYPIESEETVNEVWLRISGV